MSMAVIFIDSQVLVDIRNRQSDFLQRAVHCINLCCWVNVIGSVTIIDQVDPSPPEMFVAFLAFVLVLN